jgi:hypothetical protein
MHPQRLAARLGVVITGSYIFFVVYLLFFFVDTNDVFSFEKMTFPVTAAYVLGIGSWLFKTGGRFPDVSEDKLYGAPLVAFILMIVGVTIAGMFYIPISVSGEVVSKFDYLERNFLLLQTAFGALFGQIMSEMYGYQNRSSPSNNN